MWHGIPTTLSGFVFAVLTFSCQSSAAPPQCLITESKLVTFEIVHGRVVARNSRFGQSRGASARRSHGDLHESLCLKIRSGVACVQYERTGPSGRLIARCSAKHDFQVQLEPKAGTSTESAIYVQPEVGPCRLVVGAGDDTVTYEAATLWHLLLGRPQVCKKHLVPMLETIRPNWQLNRKAERLEAALFRSAVSGQHTSREEIWKLVQQMNGRKFQVRQEADRKLRALGHSVLGFLNNVQRDEVNAEQYRRIRSICDSLQSRTPDTPGSAAVWMLGDREIWDALARRGTPTLRDAAQQQLHRVTLRK